jgi:hypothetical protein
MLVLMLVIDCEAARPHHGGHAVVAPYQWNDR